MSFRKNWEGDDVDAVVASAKLVSDLASELRKCCANLQISMIRIRQRALDEISRSSDYWAGPNAELFRKSAKLYIDGALDVPRRRPRNMPVGLAREYTSGLIDKLKNLEKNLDESVWNFKSKAAALSNVREQLAQKKYDLDSLRGSDRQPRDSYSLLGQESIYLEAEIERLEKDETAGVDAVSDSHQELGRIWDSFNDLSEECRSGLFQCSREMSRQNSHMWEIVNNLRFEVLWSKDGPIDLPDVLFHTVIPGIVPSPKTLIADASKEWEVLRRSLVDILSSAPILLPEHADDLPSFVKNFKPVQDHLEKFPESSPNFRAFTHVITLAYFTLDSLEDMSEGELEKFLWTIYVKDNLRLPDGIFEKFFKPAVDAAFRSNLISRIMMNVFKTLFVMATAAIPGGLLLSFAIGAAATILVDYADSHVEKEQDKELERNLEDAVEEGFRDWRAAEGKKGAIDPLLYSARNM
jgi:hypothetical protein